MINLYLLINLGRGKGAELHVDDSLMRCPCEYQQCEFNDQFTIGQLVFTMILSDSNIIMFDVS
jgi:hypothetical protein